MKLQSGDIFWDGHQLCLVVKDHNIGLINIRLGNMEVGALRHNELDTETKDVKYIYNINNINKELIDLFKQQGVL